MVYVLLSNKAKCQVVHLLYLCVLGMLSVIYVTQNTIQLSYCLFTVNLNLLQISKFIIFKTNFHYLQIMKE